MRIREKQRKRETDFGCRHVGTLSSYKPADELDAQTEGVESNEETYFGFGAVELRVKLSRRNCLRETSDCGSEDMIEIFIWKLLSRFSNLNNTVILASCTSGNQARTRDLYHHT